MASSPIDHPILFQRIGLAILIAGVLIGGLVYWSAAREERDPASGAVYEDSPLSPEDSRRYSYRVEQNFGKVGVLADKWSRVVDKLSERRPMGMTIIVVSAVLAGGSFAASARLRSLRDV